MYALEREPEVKQRAWTFTLGAAVTATCCALVHTWLPSAPRIALQPPVQTKVRVVHSSRPPPAPLEQPPAPEPLPEIERRQAPTRSPKPVPNPAQTVSASNPTSMPDATPALASERSLTPLVLGLTLASPNASGPARSTAGTSTNGEKRPGDGHTEGAARHDGTSSLSEYRSVTQTSATLLRRLTPVYPKAAQHAGVEGEVILMIVIDAKGRVEAATVLKGLGYGLDESAVDAARRTEWRPASANGQPIRSTQRFSVQFKLHT